MPHSIKEEGEAAAAQDKTTKSTTSSLKRTSRLLSGGSHGVLHLLPPGDLIQVDEDRNTRDGDKYNSSNYRGRRRRNKGMQDDGSNREDDEDDDVDENGNDEETEKGWTELMIHDENRRLQWSIKFFENLHFDLNPAHREHLHEGIHRYVYISTSVPMENISVSSLSPMFVLSLSLSLSLSRLSYMI